MDHDHRQMEAVVFDLQGYWLYVVLCGIISHACFSLSCIRDLDEPPSPLSSLKRACLFSIQHTARGRCVCSALLVASTRRFRNMNVIEWWLMCRACVVYVMIRYMKRVPGSLRTLRVCSYSVCASKLHAWRGRATGDEYGWFDANRGIRG